MGQIYKQFADSLIEAERAWRVADHFIYVTLPVVKDNKLILRALENCNKTAVRTISLILKYEYIHKRISLSQEPKKNLDSFFLKCSKSYNISSEQEKFLRSLLKLAKKHKESALEFCQKDKVILLDNSGNPQELKLEEIKSFLKATRSLLENAKMRLKSP